MLKVTFDTNVFISAILSDGTPRSVLNLARQRKIKIVISGHIIEETARILREKLRWEGAEVARVLAKINKISILVFPKKQIEAIKIDRSDNRILECALEGGAHFIISGDKKHILPLKEFRGIKVVSPAQFLDIFQKADRLKY